MTEKEFTKRLPEFTNSPLPIKPPMVFNNTSVRYFPLRANLDALQQVCDGYLNIVPPEAGRFRASIPYVFMALLDYGQIAESAKQMGWFAQVELYFSVPVEWYKLVNGQWVFQDWGVITPYIFVDDSFSAPLGRTVYGFPKILSRVASLKSPWIHNALAPVTLARIETMVFPEAYTGSGLKMKTLLEIERSAPISNFRMPLDTASPMAPWNIVSNIAGALGGLGADAMWMAQAMRIFGLNNPAAHPFTLLQGVLAKVMPVFSPGGSGFIQNSLNLKQFRKSEQPDQIVYQSLTNAQIVTTAFNGGGLLGEDRRILGDFSGGHVVRLFEHSSLPIASTLGLEIEQSRQFNGSTVAEMKPVMPFWMDLDLKYENGINLAWRTNDGIWKDPMGAPFDPAQRPATRGPLFNNTAVSAIEAIAGPFEFSGATIRVLPLLAKKKKLQDFLDVYLNDALNEDGATIVHEDDPERHERVRFSVWARPPIEVSRDGYPVGGYFAYVYLTVSSFTGVTSKTNNVGDWAKDEMAFLIPVKWERWKNDKWETAGVGVVPYITLVDQDIAAISRIEVQGINTLTANFLRPENVWLSEGDASSPMDPPQTVLRVDTEVVTAAAQKSKMQPLVEIRRREPDAGLGNSKAAPWAWSEKERLELGTKKGLKAFHAKELQIGRALALELLGNETPFSIYTLKQFRDVADPDSACYQSLVRVPRILKSEDLDLREIPETIVVRIYDFLNLEIVETLGIVAERLPESATGIGYSAQAIRPFFIHTTITEPLAERLLWRAGTRTWTLRKKAFETLLSSDENNLTDDQIKELVDKEEAQYGQSWNRIAAILKQISLARSTMKRIGNATDEPAVPANDITEQRRKAAENYYKQAPPHIAVGLLSEQIQDQTDPSTIADNMYSAREHLHWILEGKNALYLLTDDPGHPQIDISKEQARHAVDWVDPQAVIEAALSREWGNNDQDALWRQGRRTLLDVTETLPQGGEHKGIVEMSLFEQLNDELASRPGAFAGMIDLREQKRLGKGIPVGTGDTQEIWRQTILDILDHQKEFTDARVKMEAYLDQISSFAILGMDKHLAVAGTESSAGVESDVPFLIKTGKGLLEQLGVISNLSLPLQPVGLADQTRLREVLGVLELKVNQPDSDFWKLEVAREHIEEFREAVALARKWCDAQLEITVKKLSRAYQKPDYCVRRDSVGAEADQLLPSSLSWDKDWYYGTWTIPPPMPSLPVFGGEPAAIPTGDTNSSTQPVRTMEKDNGAQGVIEGAG